MVHKEQLLDFINETLPQKLRVEEDFGQGFVRLNITEAQRRQSKDDIRCTEDVIVELLRNSRDAKADSIYIASWKNEHIRNLLVFDNGEGIPKDLVERIFEARVTSKLNQVIIDNYGIHGRGMALYGIALNCKEAKVVYSKKDEGTAIKVVIDTKQMPEKANQSTWPSINSKRTITAGPKNIIRKTVEYKFRNPKIKIFLGSPSETLAKLAEDGLYFLENSANNMHKKAKSLGLDVSLRNCQRISYQEITPSSEILSNLNLDRGLFGNNKKSPSVLLSKEDMQKLLDKTIEICNEEGEKYFLKVSEYASINKVGKALKITLPLENVE
ncbi:MAG: ATP-binding protein [Actinobacteria bacterium]|nr:MAG: ATP-binding protein [Actinomycetota bacterium]